MSAILDDTSTSSIEYIMRGATFAEVLGVAFDQVPLRQNYKRGWGS